MSVQSNDTNLSELLTWVEKGKAQLPDFQRSWVWDNSKICKLIESITSGYPMGAAMFLETGGENVRFTYRKFTGVSDTISEKPEFLVLDGQQRLTTLFQVLRGLNPVETCLPENRDRRIKRFYYLNIEKALNPEEDRLDAILSINEDKLVKENIGRVVKLDLSSREQEFKELYFPLNFVFNEREREDWLDEFLEYYDKHPNRNYYKDLRRRLRSEIINPVHDYKIPVIRLTKDTSKEAVCQIFENVNTGGVPLTVFELVTAMFAADGFKLREDWETIYQELSATRPLLRVIDGPWFLTSMTLLVNYKKSRQSPSDDGGRVSVSCKRKDVLKLDLADYKANRDALVNGFKRAADFLVHQGVFSEMELPYITQFIPLAAIFAYADTNGINLNLQHNKEVLSKWYWCGVFGELYGAANETRYALDIVGVIDQLEGGDAVPDTVSRSNFNATRLLSMQTRNSAAYKGVMALILQDRPLDFMSGDAMDVAVYLDQKTDIHHIFPEAYCKQQQLPSQKWNSVVNKTPIYASTNRSIGGRAPSEYIQTMRNKGLSEEVIKETISSHKVDYDDLNKDKFDDYFIKRAISLCERIEKATGKTVNGRTGEEPIAAFGRELV